MNPNVSGVFFLLRVCRAQVHVCSISKANERMISYLIHFDLRLSQAKCKNIEP